MDQFTKEQLLLVEEIINKGYDSDEFQEFVVNFDSIKGNDLEQWSFEELAIVIKQFQEMKSQKLSMIFPENELPPQQQSEIDGFQIIDEQVYEQYAKKMMDKIKINEKIYVDPYQRQIKCKPQQFYIEEDIELHFITNPPQEERGGFFSFYKKAIVFQIQINPMQWKVHRTLQDFQQLRNILAAEFPEQLIQVFPQFNGDDFEFIIQEQEAIIRVINSFLQILNKTKIFRTSPAVLMFLNETNCKHFHQRFYKDANLNKNYSLPTKQKKNNKIDINFNAELYKNCKEYENFIQNDYILYQEIEKSFDSFVTHMAKGAEYLSKSQMYMQKLIQKLPQFGEAMNFGNVLVMLKNYIQSVKDGLLRQTNLIKESIQITIIKCSHSKQPLTELRLNLNETQQNFVNEHNLLEKRKEDLYQIKDIQKWGIQPNQLGQIDISKAYFDMAYAKGLMCQKDQQLLHEKQDQFSYMVQCFCENVNRQFYNQKCSLIEHIGQFLSYLQEHSIKQVQQWTTFMQEYESLKQNK